MNISVKWETVKREHKCKSCGEAIPPTGLKLHICRTLKQRIHICESCFLKAQEDYNNG
jgi:hypothetical protein